MPYTDIYHLGPTPMDEPCAQVGRPDYARDAKRECEAYIRAIQRVHGKEPKGAKLKIVSAPHGMDTTVGGSEYFEVAIFFDGNNRVAAEYAANVDDNPPATWEEAGLEPPVNRGNSR